MMPAARAASASGAASRPVSTNMKLVWEGMTRQPSFVNCPVNQVLSAEF